MSHQYQIRNFILVASAIALLAGCNQPPAPAAPIEPAAPAVPNEVSVTEQSAAMVPTGPWPQGDQRGMANTLGARSAQ